MADTLVKSIEMILSTAAVGDGPARQTTQPVQRRIVGPLSARPTTGIPIAKPLLPREPGAEVELDQIRKAWRKYQATNSRNAVYIYLTRVFAVVTRWQRLDCALQNARTALRLQADAPQMKPEPFAIVIFCTSNSKLDAKTRSKWSRVLRYAARAKPAGQRVTGFIKSSGGINECARRFTRSRRRVDAFE